MSEAEKRELQELISLLYGNNISQYGKRRLEEYINKQQKVIDLMAEQMSKRPLMIFQGNEKENSVEILKEPKEIIDYYTKKAEE